MKCDISDLWTAVCNDDRDYMTQYYSNGGEPNRRYCAFRRNNSLIMGAFRNRNYEMVKLLQENGETVEPYEAEEFAPYCNYELADAAQKLVDYFSYHNKNLTKAQNELLENLTEALKDANLINEWRKI